MPKINLLNNSNRLNSNFSNTIKYDESIKNINNKIDSLTELINRLKTDQDTFTKDVSDNHNNLIQLLMDNSSISDISDTSLNNVKINGLLI
tara:strand:- start:1840 stop:2112 length:273 start_codon:yes stop_codon:yes gene_type:complete